MKISKIKDIIIRIVKDYFEIIEQNIEVNDETCLFGVNAVLDSMGLVNVIVDIESIFLDDGIEITLTSEKAMSRRNSPFRTIETLAEFIIEQIEVNNE